jgi:hypothetical protein
MDMERDLGIGIEPYTESELELLYRFIAEAADEDPGERNE